MDDLGPDTIGSQLLGSTIIAIAEYRRLRHGLNPPEHSVIVLGIGQHQYQAVPRLPNFFHGNPQRQAKILTPNAHHVVQAVGHVDPHQ